MGPLTMGIEINMPSKCTTKPCNDYACARDSIAMTKMRHHSKDTVRQKPE